MITSATCPVFEFAQQSGGVTQRVLSRELVEAPDFQSVEI